MHPAASEQLQPQEVRPLVELVHVTKRFPGVVANDAVDLRIMPGEVHALLGENGAGKSTLIGILSGVHRPDEGEILVEGRATAIASPAHALALGIGTVYQHTMLVPTLTVAENLILGEAWWRKPRRAELAGRVGELAQSLGLEVRLDAPAGELSLGQQQQVEILRALLRKSRLLVLDEPTSMLTPKGIEELGKLMRRLAARGLAVLFITHKLDEAREFGDRISILRLGRKVGEIPPERLARMEKAQAIDEIIKLMFGSEAAAAGEPREREAVKGAAPVLEVRGLTIEDRGTTIGGEGIDLAVAPGEILGIAGIDGNGQKQLAEALAGQRPAASGDILFGGERINHMDVGARRRLGLRYLTDDRLSEGSVAPFPLSLNLVLKEIGKEPYWRRGIEQRDEITGHAERLIERFDVRTPGPETPIGRLSGGNIQKALLARELVEGARAVIFSKPTYGLDAQNTIAFRRRIREIAAAGIAVVLVSTDLEELLELSDRIAVMSRGRLVGTVPNDEQARIRVGGMMVGVAA